MHKPAVALAAVLLLTGDPRHAATVSDDTLAKSSFAAGILHPFLTESPEMFSTRPSACMLLLAAVACTPPGPLTTDGLDAPNGAPPFAPTALFPNAPTEAGWLTVTDLQWASDAVPFRFDPIYEPDNGSHLVEYGQSPIRYASIINDPDLPLGLKRALHYRLPAGQPGGGSPSMVGQHPDYHGDGPLTWGAARNTGHLYLGYWVRFSPNYSLNGNVGQKVFYLKSDVPENSGINHMPGINMNDGAGGNQLWPEYQPQSPFGTNNFRVPGTSANNLNDGRWHLVEILQGPNTPGRSNGTLRLWIDQRLEGNWTNAWFFDAGMRPTLNVLLILPIFGGGANPVPRDQWLRLGPVLVRSR